MAPPPIREVDWLAEKFVGGAAKSQRLGAAIRRSAERLGTAFLDAGEHIEVSPIDGLHYDAATHATLGKAIAAAVRELATGSTKA